LTDTDKQNSRPTEKYKN